MAKATKCEKNTDQNYVDSLEAKEKERYLSKIEQIGGIDPYQVDDLSSDWNCLPAVTYPDIVNYLLFTPSPYTATDLKCYKGLEAYNQMVCGCVRDVVSKKVQRKCLVKAKVNSFRPSRSFFHFIFDSPF